MTPEVYGHEFRKYSVIMRNSASNLCLIGSGANHNDWKWARDFLYIVENSDRNMGGFSLYFYCGTQGTATEFTENQYYRLLLDLNAYGVRFQDICEYELLTSADVHNHNTPEKVKLSNGVLNLNEGVVLPPYSVITLKAKSV